MAECREELNIEDFTYDEDLEMYFYPCSCGGKYEIFKGDIRNGDDIATCSDCSTKIKIIYNPDDFQHDSDTMPGESPGYVMGK
ncbi:diphthamide biosynthesis protein 3-like [Centruroides vittatus]|uniref:diphthamide biosynthesis protein 3-like n=1 Tax=Centruroides vittatus TaxID=120091 RepID=UPI00351009D0